MAGAHRIQPSSWHWSNHAMLFVHGSALTPHALQEFDDAELERIASVQDQEELPTLAFVPNILRSDDEVMKQVRP